MVAAEAVRTRISADDFFGMSFPDDEKVELVRGEVIRMSPAGGEHGLVAGNIHGLLFAQVKAGRLGIVCAAETGFIVARDPDTVRGPDVGFVSRERLEAHGRTQKFWPFAPDLAVEVVSPHDTAEQVEEKTSEWLTGGARMVWVVYPVARRVHVYRSLEAVRILSESDTLEGEDVAPGFACRVAELFE